MFICTVDFFIAYYNCLVQWHQELAIKHYEQFIIGFWKVPDTHENKANRLHGNYNNIDCPKPRRWTIVIIMCWYEATLNNLQSKQTVNCLPKNIKEKENTGKNDDKIGICYVPLQQKHTIISRIQFSPIEMFMKAMNINKNKMLA